MATAMLAINSCNGDASKEAQAPAAAAAQSDKRFTVEVWEESLVNGLGSHAAIVLRDRQQDEVILLEGLATNRKTFEVSPIGSASKDDIYAYAKIERAEALPSNGNKREWRATLLQTNDGIDAVARMTAILQAANKINRQQYAYELLSSSTLAGQEAYNSNAMATSLLKAAGLKANGVSFNGFAPGWGQTIPGDYTEDRKRLRSLIARAGQERATGLITALAGRMNAHGSLSRSKDIYDQALVDSGGLRVGEFVKAMDYNGEGARRNAQIARYQALPECERLSAPELPRFDVAQVPHTGKPLYADNVVDEYRTLDSRRDNRGYNYVGQTQYKVVTASTLDQGCRTDLILESRDELKATAKLDKQLDKENAKFLAEQEKYKPGEAKRIKPKIRVHLNL